MNPTNRITDLLSTIPPQKTANYIGWLSIILSALAQLLFTPVVISYLGEQGLGAWFIIFQTFSCLQLVDIGISDAITRELSISTSEKNSTPAIDLIYTSKQILLGIGILFSACGFAAAAIIPKFISITTNFKNDFTISICLLAFWGLFRYYSDLSRLSLRGTNKLIQFNLLILIEGVGRPIVGIFFLSLTHTLSGIMVGYILVELFTRIIANLLYPTTKSGKHSKTYLKRLLHFGAGTSVIRLSSLIVFYNASFIIGWKLNLAAIAKFQCSIALPYLFYRFLIVPFTNYLPKLVHTYHKFGYEQLKESAIKLHFKVGLFTIAIYFIVMASNQTFINIWVGNSLFAGHSFSITYSFFCILSVLRHNGYMVWQATGNLKLMSMAHIFEIPISFIVSILLIDNLGLSAIPLAYITGQLPAFLISQFFVTKKHTITRA